MEACAPKTALTYLLRATLKIYEYRFDVREEKMRIWREEASEIETGGEANTNGHQPEHDRSTLKELEGERLTTIDMDHSQASTEDSVSLNHDENLNRDDVTRLNENAPNEPQKNHWKSDILIRKSILTLYSKAFVRIGRMPVLKQYLYKYWGGMIPNLFRFMSSFFQ
jgi:hypothetical protein